MDQEHSGSDQSDFVSRQTQATVEASHEQASHASMSTNSGQPAALNCGDLATSGGQPHSGMSSSPCFQSHPVASLSGVHHQLFRQHAPFGTENHHYRPVEYLPQFSIRFPLDQSSLPPRQKSKLVTNGFHQRHDSPELETGAGGETDRETSHKRISKIDHTVRLKSSRVGHGKAKLNKKKQEQRLTGASSEVVEKTTQLNYKSHSEVLGVPINGDQLEKSSTAPSVVGMVDNGNLDIDNTVSEYFDPDPDREITLGLNLVEGAVGGFVCEDMPSGSDSKDKTCHTGGSFDKYLIDEGAVCDFDKVFQLQELAMINGYGSDDESSRDTALCDRHSSKRIKSGASSECDNVNTSLSDEESESANCSYVYNPEFLNVRSDALLIDSSQCSNVGKSSYFGFGERHQLNERREELSGDGRSGTSVSREPLAVALDDMEDTGDFIDTDLPSHNKHILSSSDEMDSSSNSFSDQEDNAENQDRRNVQAACNDLSCIEAKVQNGLEDLSVVEHLKVCKTSAKSHYLNTKIENNLITSLSPAFPRTVPLVNSNSAEDAVTTFHSPMETAQIKPVLVEGCDLTNQCSVGAAASPLPLEMPQKHDEDLYNTHPPGADCEPSQTFSSQCCHLSAAYECSPEKRSPGLCATATLGSCKEHTAFIASSATGFDISQQTNLLGVSYCRSIGSDTGAGSSGYPTSTVNDLSRCLGHEAPEVNYFRDEINRHHNLFVKFQGEDKMDDRGSYSASSCDMEDNDLLMSPVRKIDVRSDSGGSEDPLSHDSGDSVDMVLLPMEEEIEPVHHLGAGLCAGGVEEGDYFYHDLQLSGAFRPTSVTHHSEEPQCVCFREQSPLRQGLPSKEFYDLIKTVSTTDSSYMRFFDKDGQDVQRQPIMPCGDGDDDEDVDESGKPSTSTGGQGTKAERLKVDRVMIWNEYEAYVMQFKQIAVSACGQTAVLNVLKALKFNCEKSAVCKAIQTNLRKEDASIPEYLFSRAKAGTTAEELMLGVEKLSAGTVGGRFFHFWPPRNVKLLPWLASWMKRGAIPIATLNLQQGPHSLWQVPDSWHHQMVYGVSHQGLYLTNPLEIVSERSAMKQLCSDSVLMVRRQDIISRFRETTDLSQLLTHPDPRWRSMNVLGQVVNVLREFNMPSVPGYRLQVTSHVTIPASYKAGVTLFMPKDKSAWASLMAAQELPVLELDS